MEIVHVVRCSNCGCYYSDCGQPVSVSDAWFVKDGDRKYLQRGMGWDEFKKNCCDKSELYIAEFHEVLP